MNARISLSQFARAIVLFLALVGPGCALLTQQVNSGVRYDQDGGVLYVSLADAADQDTARAALERLASGIATCPSYTVTVVSIENTRGEEKDGEPTATATVTGRYSCFSGPIEPAS